MTHSPTETEIKLAMPDVRTAKRLLRAAGFLVSRRRVFESNVVFDTPTLTLRTASTLLRVRQAAKYRRWLPAIAALDGSFDAAEVGR